MRGQAIASHAPRMLHCQFPFGRPLGRPGDAEFQHRVLAAALSLVARVDTPVLEDFPVTIDDAADEPLACAIPPRLGPSEHPAVDEAIALQPAYERARERSGRTGVSRDGGADSIPRVVGLLARVAAGESPEDTGHTDQAIAVAARDVRAFYEEAALALSDLVPAARQAESWLYRTTEAGRVLIGARNAMRVRGVPSSIWFALVPAGQPGSETR